MVSYAAVHCGRIVQWDSGENTVSSNKAAWKMKEKERNVHVSRVVLNWKNLRKIRLQQGNLAKMTLRTEPRTHPSRCSVRGLARSLVNTARYRITLSSPINMCSLVRR